MRPRPLGSGRQDRVLRGRDDSAGRTGGARAPHRGAPFVGRRLFHARRSPSGPAAARAAPRDKRLAEITRLIAMGLEHLIRKAPEQWHLLQPNWPSDRVQVREPLVRIGLVCPYDLGRPGGVQQQVLDIGRLLAAAGESSHNHRSRGPDCGRCPYRTCRGRASPTGQGQRLGGSAGLWPGRWSTDPRGRRRTRRPPRSRTFDPGGRARRVACRPSVVATFHALPPAWMSLAYRFGPPRWLERAMVQRGR